MGKVPTVFDLKREAIDAAQNVAEDDSVSIKIRLDVLRDIISEVENMIDGIQEQEADDE